MPNLGVSPNLSTHRLKIKQKNGDHNVHKVSRRVNTEYQIEYKEDTKFNHQ